MIGDKLIIAILVPCLFMGIFLVNFYNHLPASKYAITQLGDNLGFVQLNTESGDMRFCAGESMNNYDALVGLFEIDGRIVCGPWRVEPFQ